MGCLVCRQSIDVLRCSQIGNLLICGKHILIFVKLVFGDNMEVQVVRKIFTEKTTIGELWINGQYECETLEDRTRAPGVKVKKETAIPYGRYRLVIDFSERFQKDMPHILDVPMFTGIRIHAGNTEVDTEGCLLLGLVSEPDKVLYSRQALAHFNRVLQFAIDKEAVWIMFKSASGDNYYLQTEGNA